MHPITLLVLGHTVLASTTNLLMPPPDGIYKVKWENEELVDTHRIDPFNSTHPRRMMISRFKPILAPLCTKTCRVSVWPKELADLEDAIYEAYYAGTGWPTGIFSSLELQVCCRSIPAPFLTYPKILFGTGLNTTRLSYASTAQHLASRGYEVIVMDHPYETDLVQFPNGDIIPGGHVIGDRQNTTSLELGLDIRSADAAFVMDALGIKKTVMIGQSYGGAAAADILLRDSRVVGGVNLDGAMFGHAVAEGVPHPFVVFGSQDHNSTSEPTWRPFFEAMDKKRPNVWDRELSFVGSGHGSFTDMSVVGDISGLRNNTVLVDYIFGNILGSHAMVVFKEYMDDFIQFALGRSNGPGLLAGPDPRYPDVGFLRASH